MPLNFISLYMNDFLNILIKDISSIVDTLIKAQIVQSKEDLFQVKVVPISNWDDSKEEILINRLKKRIGDLTIEIQLCHDILPEINGKFRVIKSYVK